MTELSSFREKSDKLPYGSAVKWGASSRWSSSLYFPMRYSDEMTIEKMHPTLVILLPNIDVTNFLSLWWFWSTRSQDRPREYYVGLFSTSALRVPKAFRSFQEVAIGSVNDSGSFPTYQFKPTHTVWVILYDKTGVPAAKTRFWPYNRSKSVFYGWNPSFIIHLWVIDYDSYSMSHFEWFVSARNDIWFS